MRLVVVCPHFEPDIAPTGAVMTRIVHELARRGHELHVVTSLPWYRGHRVEPGWGGRPWRVERTPWGSVTRIHPMSSRSKANVAGRALGFVAFSVLAAAWCALRRVGGRVDAVVAMSPPLTLGLAGRIGALVRRCPLVFNVQDVFPDAAIATGAVRSRALITAARGLERATYLASDAVVVLSDDLARNVGAKLAPSRRSRVHVIPNFVDTAAIGPGPRRTPYRAALGIGDEPVVMYAGNVGFSQGLEMLVEAARALPGVAFVIHGAGAARDALRESARGVPNVRFGDYQPADRLAEVLATADLHVVTLRRGLGHVSVPSKTYSVLAAGRPVLAAIDADTEVPRILAASGAGRTVPPDDGAAFVAALREMLADPDALARMGRDARAWVEGHASPASIAARYEALIASLASR
ncbi:MAG: glycosyltransferase family 4 protein [Acidimicrobiia bacterium]